jgi:hypothetical protein
MPQEETIVNNSEMSSQEILEITRADMMAICDAMHDMVTGMDIVIDRQEASPTPLKAILLRGTIQASIALIQAYLGVVPHQALEHLDRSGERQ